MPAAAGRDRIYTKAFARTPRGKRLSAADEAGGTRSRIGDRVPVDGPVGCACTGCDNESCRENREVCK